MSFFSSLSNRIFMATAALAVLAIAVAVYRINVAVTAQAENELRRGLVEAGTLVPVVDRVVPLARAADAYRHLDRPGKRGVTVLEVP